MRATGRVRPSSVGSRSAWKQGMLTTAEAHRRAFASTEARAAGTSGPPCPGSRAATGGSSWDGPDRGAGGGLDGVRRGPGCSARSPWPCVAIPSSALMHAGRGPCGSKVPLRPPVATRRSTCLPRSWGRCCRRPCRGRPKAGRPAGRWRPGGGRTGRGRPVHHPARRQIAVPKPATAPPRSSSWRTTGLRPSSTTISLPPSAASISRDRWVLAAWIVTRHDGLPERAR